MGLTEFASVKVPPFNDFSLPERILGKTDSIANVAKEKGSFFLKGLDLSLEWVMNMSHLAPNDQEKLGLAEKGFKEAGALETLVSLGTDIPQAGLDAATLRDKITAWKKGELETPKIQDVAKKTFFGCLFPLVKKVDDVFWALDNFDLFKWRSVNIFHGVGYGIGSLIAAKNLYDAGKELHEMKTNLETQPVSPGKRNLALIKLGKFASNIGAAITGLALLVATSVKLSFLYLGFSTSSLGLTLSEHMIDKVTDPGVKEQKMLEEKLKREKTFQMIT